MDNTQVIPTLLLTPRQTAQILNISERSLATYTARGDFPVVRIGRSVRYDVEVLRQWIQDHTERKSENLPK